MGRGWVHGVRLASGAKKGKLFTKIAKEITVAVKMGGGASPDTNSRLKGALKDAQKNSMPKDTIDRAIKRGLGATDDAALEEIVYEGYGPHGVAVMVEALTDNRNRTVQDLRSVFTRHKGNLGQTNSVAFTFDRVASVIAIVPAGKDAEEVAINAGANEVEDLGEGQQFRFLGGPTDLDSIQKALHEEGLEVVKGELAFKSKTPTQLTPEQEKDLQEFIEALDDSDDVKNYHLSV